MFGQMSEVACTRAGVHTRCQYVIGLESFRSPPGAVKCVVRCGNTKLVTRSGAIAVRVVNSADGPRRIRPGGPEGVQARIASFVSCSGCQQDENPVRASFVSPEHLLPSGAYTAKPFNASQDEIIRTPGKLAHLIGSVESGRWTASINS